MKLIEEYFLLETKYKEKYGEQTFLLMQVGSFFEVYGMQDIHMKTIQCFSNICNLAIANKKICIGQNNVVMSGFRDYLLEKYIEKVHPYGYSVVVFVQEEDVKGNIKRKECGVFSPGTTFIENNTTLSNNISCVWIQKSKTLNKEAFIFGLSNIDIYNGTTNLCEYYEKYYHNPTTYDCIEKFLNVYNPIEIIFIHNIEEDQIKQIIQFLNTTCKKKYIVDIEQKENTLSKQALNCESQIYQDEIIKTFFPHVNLEIFKYNLNDKPICLQSYCFLLNFVQQHNVSLIQKIHEPNIEHIETTLVCANHSFKQLNFIAQHQDNKLNTMIDDSEQPINCVLSLLNQCKTKMGKRHMNQVLLNPICDIEKLNERYTMIEHIIKQKYNFNDILGQVKDLDKYLTKLKLFKLNPNDIYYLYTSLYLIDDVQQIIKKDKSLRLVLKQKELNKNQKQFRTYLDTTFDIKIAQNILSTNFDKYEEFNYKLIQKGNFPKLDEQIKKTFESKDKLNVIIDFLESCFTKKEKDVNNYIKQHQPGTGELCLIITNKRSKMLMDNIKINKKMSKCAKLKFTSSYDNEEYSFDFDLDDIHFKDYNKTSKLLYSSIIDELKKSIHEDYTEFKDILNDSYHKILKHIIHNYFEHIENMIYFLKILDMYNNYVFLAKHYNLCKPQIKSLKEEENNKRSYVQAKKMRHILIENIDKNEIYVPNDIDLGVENTKLGMLLFGTNAVGKTSLIKALGICVIMAQSGCFVPCEKFMYYPYKYIFTRIIGNDNIFKGLSTFGVEMSELRVILNQCNENSLILGDELCSGTEIDSALAIFMSSLEVLTKRKSNFIFATHFHEIQEFKELDELNSIQLKHLKVIYNHEKNTLVYDRTLQDGAGESIYGLEVCKSLNMPNDFLEKCYDIRNRYMDNKNNLLLMKTSKYNKSKIKSKCEFCKKKMGTEIHHLQYQKDANQNDYINNSFHKNHNANLASICEECHHHIHSLNLVYERRKTIQGNYEFIIKKK